MSIIDTLLDLPREEQEALLREHPEAIEPLLTAVQRERVELSPLSMAAVADPKHRQLPHLDYLDARLTDAVRRVEDGESVFIRISMPPRSGKSVTSSEFLPLWLLCKHPDWKIGLVSHAPALAAAWGRQIRRMVEEDRIGHGLRVAHDAGSVTDWETTERGGVTSRSVGGSLTGRGFKVLIVDDVVKDYADAASETKRQSIRDWWHTTARTRLEPPSLVIVIGTRWHEDDFTGWVDTAGDPFETIIFEAIATVPDALGRDVGDPLYSPFITETRDEALARWKSVEVAVGPYAWAALYQQSPHPAGGTIFHRDWFKYWTRDPLLVTESGSTILLIPEATLGMTWLDSWDVAIEDKETADYTVGQRWAKDQDQRRFLIGQSREQTEFVDTLARMREWGKPESLRGTGARVTKRYIEKAANGYATLSTLKRELSGVEGVEAKGSKEVRAMAVTPEVAAGLFYLPHPQEPGNEWVWKWLDEVCAFPTAKHDDQVDAFTMAAAKMQTPQATQAAKNPGAMGTVIPAGNKRVISAARTGIRRSAGG